MNGDLATNRALLDELVTAIGRIPGLKSAVCPPYPYLGQVQHALSGSGIAWGAQDVSQFENGAYTGEVSGAMLVDFGCRYVIVGHSERRTLFGETNELVAEKYAAALKAGLTPILCVGETLRDREAGHTEATVAAQLRAVLERNGVQSFAHAVVARRSASSA
jgi:triosephosphate isomerase